MAAHGGPNISTDGLVLHLDAANEQSYPGTGNTWYDLSGNNRNASKGGTQSPSYPLWHSEGYFEFSGGVLGTNYSRFDVSLPQMNEVTAIGVWNASVTGGHVFRLSNSDLQIGPNGFTAGDNYNDINVSGSVVVGDNNWHIGQLTFDGTTLNAYLDGEFFGTNTKSPSDVDGIAAGTLRIGSRDDNYFAHFFGYISCIQIYSKVLTEKELNQNYTALRGRYGL